MGHHHLFAMNTVGFLTNNSLNFLMKYNTTTHAPLPYINRTKINKYHQQQNNTTSLFPSMESSSTTLNFPASKTLSSRRTASFSSFSSSFSSCSSSYFPDDQSPVNPSTPLRFSGVPFSWEQLPGIPKKVENHHNASVMPIVLPLPPPTTSKKVDSEEFGIGKKVSTPSDWRDPFFAALVKCSKGDHHRNNHQNSTGNFWSDDGPRVSRSVNDRFSFCNLYTSCKRSCDVAESLTNAPRSRRTSYDRINCHRSN